jgi:hypothetical protein
MSLPSQSARGGGRSAAVSTRRRRKSPFRSALPFLIVIVLVVIVWFTVRPAGVRDEPGAPDVAAEGAVDGADAPFEIAQGRQGPARSEPAAPPRVLPGSQEPAPDEVDRAIDAGRAGRDQTPRTTPSPAPAEPAAPAGRARPPAGAESGGVLTQALGDRPAETRRASTPARAEDAGAGRVRMQIDTARRLVAENDRVGARALLSRVLRDPGLGTAEADLLRDELTEINNHLVFGRVVERGDPIAEEYRVQAGDSLSRIASRRELATHWKLIQRVNGLSDPTKIRLDQTLKLVRGPFHAVVDKSDFRMDVWHGPPSDPSRWVYVRSFDVGLGEGDGTPVGSFVVSANKLENPGWVNPRDSRERYEPNDPRNPIGEFWLGLDGVGASEGVAGYGIHGTIDPGSIGENKSMGCVRLRDEDIAMVYELLAERVSRVEIVP